MTNNHIILENVNLYYQSAAFKERSLKAFLGQALSINKQNSPIQDIHALKNLSVQISQGERIGVLGHNGAGKSTFLKCVAGLYPVTSGKLDVNGHITSLLELNLGFEPEATGRENILYRGLLLGFSPTFINQKVVEIIQFADIGIFIDYPIKTYSAGMLVRLAFAISTSVGGDILLLDEIIGAGDANFIEKARQRILSLVAEAKILVLVSHDLGALSSICERGLVFKEGGLDFDGPIDLAIEHYQNLNKVLAA